MDLLQKMFLLVGHEKNVIYSKLVNNPFKNTEIKLSTNVCLIEGKSKTLLTCQVQTTIRIFKKLPFETSLPPYLSLRRL